MVEMALGTKYLLMCKLISHFVKYKTDCGWSLQENYYELWRSISLWRMWRTDSVNGYNAVDQGSERFGVSHLFPSKMHFIMDAVCRRNLSGKDLKKKKKKKEKEKERERFKQQKQKQNIDITGQDAFFLSFFF